MRVCSVKWSRRSLDVHSFSFPRLLPSIFQPFMFIQMLFYLCSLGFACFARYVNCHEIPICLFFNAFPFSVAHSFASYILLLVQVFFLHCIKGSFSFIWRFLMSFTERFMLFLDNESPWRLDNKNMKAY